METVSKVHQTKEVSLVPTDGGEEGTVAPGDPVHLSMRRGHQREGEIWQSRKEEAISSIWFCHF